MGTDFAADDADAPPFGWSQVSGALHPGHLEQTPSFCRDHVAVPPLEVTGCNTVFHRIETGTAGGRAE
jgi:hypothetical protein